MTEDWEKKMLEQMAEMLRGMGMSVDMDQLKALMKQFKTQFDSMGFDPEKIAKGDMKFNFDMSNLMKLFQSGMPMEDMLSNLGVDVKVDAAPPEVTIDDGSPQNDIVRLPADDIYLSGWNMSITVDFSTRQDFDEIEVALSSGGELLHVLDDPADHTAVLFVKTCIFNHDAQCVRKVIIK